MPLGLWNYRGGNYAAAIDWCERGLAQKSRSGVCDADLHLVLAMAEYQTGHLDEACAELEEGRDLVETKLKSGLERGRGDIGYWFDWLFAGQLLKEAAALMDCSSVQSGLE